MQITKSKDGLRRYTIRITYMVGLSELESACIIERAGYETEDGEGINPHLPNRKYVLDLTREAVGTHGDNLVVTSWDAESDWGENGIAALRTRLEELFPELKMEDN